MDYMELFRGDGRRTWQCRLTDHCGRRRQFSTRTSDRGTALAITHKVERLKDARMRGDPMPEDLAIWLANTHEDLRAKLIDWQLVDGAAVGAGELLFNPPPPDPLPPDWKSPPSSLLERWELEMLGEEVTPDHARQSAARVRKLFQVEVSELLPMRYPGDITSASVMPRIRELRRVGAPHGHKKRKREAFSPKTCQYYLDRASDFCGWLVTKGILRKNPLAGEVAYTAPVIRANKKYKRRPLSIDEQLLLITGVPQLPDRHGMTGTERARIYHLALRTGLRAKETRTLCAKSVNLFTKQITVLAGTSKARREDVIPIIEELIEPLREQLAGKLPGAPVFTHLAEKKYCAMLHEDLEALGIPIADDLGRVVDFHALRHTYGTELARVVMPAEHMKLMRHRDYRTTSEYYIHLEQKDQAAAIAKLPRLQPTAANNNTKAGA